MKGLKTYVERFNRNGDRRRIAKSIESDIIISESESDLEYKKKLFAMERGPAVANQMLKHGLVGTPEKIRERLKQYTDAGVDQFLLAFQDPLDIKALELFMERRMQISSKKRKIDFIFFRIPFSQDL